MRGEWSISEVAEYLSGKGWNVSARDLSEAIDAGIITARVNGWSGHRYSRLMLKKRCIRDAIRLLCRPGRMKKSLQRDRIMRLHRAGLDVIAIRKQMGIKPWQVEHVIRVYGTEKTQI